MPIGTLFWKNIFIFNLIKMQNVLFFILVVKSYCLSPPLLHSLCIVNDQLFIRMATTEEIRRAFVAPAPTPSSSPVPTLTAQQQEMLTAFSQKSGMNLEWSQKWVGFFLHLLILLLVKSTVVSNKLFTWSNQIELVNVFNLFPPQVSAGQWVEFWSCCTNFHSVEGKMDLLLHNRLIFV